MDRTIDGDAVIVAAGSWTPEIAVLPDWTADPERPTMPPPVKPIRGQLLRLRSAHRIAPHVLWGSGCYIVPWQRGTVLVGATVEDVGFDDEPTVAGVQDLLAAATSLVPALRGAVFEQVRVGFRPMAADELPIIGRSSTMPRVFYATGHYRNGILLAPLTAKLMADLVLEDRAAPELELTRPARFGL
jgi:glycine/D-amino acid oxidase-like deaminating enzyme